MSHSSVVRIFATTQQPDFDCPWQALPPSSGTGSGVVIEDGRVLTGAHVVANSTFLQVQKVSDPKKYVAQVVAICHDCDLALLSIEDQEFMSGTQSAKIGTLPTLQDRVSVVGFPVGGEEISISEGVVSRIEVQRYSHSQRHLLAVTIDAAINAGNSGGPVFKDGKVVGIAFQKLTKAENIGEMVPAQLIKRFLAAKEDNIKVHVPGLGIYTQNLENAVLRKHIGLPEQRSGVLIQSVDYGNSAWNILQPGDALLSLGGLPIANNGTVRYADTHRTSFRAILGEHSVGEQLECEVLRNGQVCSFHIPLSPRCRLVPSSRYERLPSYFLYGGLVFQQLCRDFLSTWNDEWWNQAPKEFLHHYYLGVRTEQQHEVVILSSVLADPVNIGYQDLGNECVESVNGVCPRDMKHFVELIEGADSIVELRMSSRQVVVLDRQQVTQATPSLMKRYHVPRDRSGDLVCQ